MNVGNYRNTIVAQVMIERFARAQVGVDTKEFAHDKAFCKHAARFYVLFVNAVIPDQRISHRYDLPAVGWIGQDLLITGHCGVKDNFAYDFSLCAEASAVPNSSVF